MDVLELCSHFLGKALIIADQTYIEYSNDTPLPSEIDAHPNLLMLRTLPKECSLVNEQPGDNIAHPEVVGLVGWIVVPRPLTQSAIAAVTAKALAQARIEYAHANIGRLLKERRRVERRAEHDAEHPRPS